MFATAIVAALALQVAATGQTAPFLLNGDFEQWREVTLGPDGLVSGWTLGDPPLVPTGWSLNSAYPGRLEVGSQQPHSGTSFVRITAPEEATAHLYQMCTGLEAGQWYRVSAWTRGGSVTLSFYEYFPDRIGGQTVAQRVTRAEDWQLIWGYYRPLGEGYQQSALAISVPYGEPAEIDDVAVVPALASELLPEGPDVVLENDVARLAIAADGTIRELRCKASGKNYAAGPVPFPLMSAVRRGITTPIRSVAREGDLLGVRFLDTEVTVSLRITARPRHFLIEVVDVQPQDVEQLSLEIPVLRLAKTAWAFNATYDDEFGVCLFGTTANVLNQPTGRPSGIQGLGTTCFRRHGIVGAGIALVAARADQFKEAVMEAERANGLPCPVLDGQWARDSERVRESYLFATDLSEANVDAFIEYAQVGGFGTIIAHKDCFLANHGHYDINVANFPEGRASFKRVVRKVHDAGLHFGVHVFGPSISPNDPYITPRPDDRLAAVSLPPLGEAVDEQATTLTLAAPPDIPLQTARTVSFPGSYLRLGDEIISYAGIEEGPPYRFIGCTRGACGTTPAAHPSGTPVRHLLNLWGYFLVDPDSSLADELTSNFADLVNDCELDMVYFDASDNGETVYMDWWYYLNVMHPGFYRKFDREVLYQTSMGTGSNLTWHLVPRSASADGHGDIKGYLDERWPGILAMADNWTRADIGWYYWFSDEARPDQMEYVCAKAAGVEGSISIETSRVSLETLPQSRRMLETVGRWERARLANAFSETVRSKLREPQADFRLFPAPDGGWRLFRAKYEEPRVVAALDGEQNVWTIHNPLDRPCLLGVDIVRGGKPVPHADFDDPAAVTVETFDDVGEYQMSEHNDYEKFVVGDKKQLLDCGPVRQGVTQSFTATAEGARVGQRCMLYAAHNAGGDGGWCGIGRRFPQPLNLTGNQVLGLWIHGDGKGESIRFQLWDSAGRHADWLPTINYTGWKLHFFPMIEAGDFDWSRVEYLLFYFNGIPAQTSVQVLLDDLRALPRLLPSPKVARPALTVNGETTTFPVTLEPGFALTSEGPLGVILWPPGMAPGEPVEVPTSGLILQPGDNQVVFTCESGPDLPGDVRVLLYRMWEMEE